MKKHNFIKFDTIYLLYIGRKTRSSTCTIYSFLPALYFKLTENNYAHSETAIVSRAGNFFKEKLTFNYGREVHFYKKEKINKRYKL